MTNGQTNVVVLGATGSIGCSTLEVIAASNGRLNIVGLSAHSNVDLLKKQSQRFRPRQIVLTAPNAAEKHDWSDLPPDVELLTGPEAVEKMVTQDDVHIVVSAIVGSAGLKSTWASLEAGKTVALANKDSLVVGGNLVTQLAKKNNAQILPVDSEHSAIFQALQTGRQKDLKQVVLTASGGPFRKLNKQRLAKVTVKDALAHPTWDMGPKVTIDSATMMNKALEIIEARWLFELEPNQIRVVIHPQSVVHSMVEFVDGSVLAQLSPPDMKLPIQYALTWPDRCVGIARKLDWSEAFNLEFEPPDLERFESLSLGLEVARTGGTAGAVLNAANEAAVEAFIAEKIGFLDIAPACRAVLKNHNFDPNPKLDDLFRLDRWARQEVLRWINST